MEGRKPPIKKLITKKLTGPLFTDDVLNELCVQPASSSSQKTLSVHSPSTEYPQFQQQSSNLHSRRIPSVKDKKEKKRERWLLTRKTWKYMADAGRKLIPDGAQNRPEDIQKCERHFHNLCANEPRFILWRRKASYPGAMGASRNSKRRLKVLLSHSHKGIGSHDYESEESRNTDQIIDLLSSYLKLDESRKITTLLGSKTVRPDQTSSPSAQRPGGSSASRGGLSSQSMAMSSRGPGFLPPFAQPPKGINALSEIDQLLERLRTLSRSSTCNTIIPIERITPEILEDKVLLKQIYNELKKQQLHRIIGKHSSCNTGPRTSLPHASSLSSLWHFRRDGSTKGSFSSKTSFLSHFGLKSPPTSTPPSTSPPPPLSPPGREYNNNKRIPPTSLDLSSSTKLQFQCPPAPQITSVIKKPSPRMTPVTFATNGTQTNFIQLNEIERLAKEYREMKQEEAAAAASSIAESSIAGQPNDNDSDKGATASQIHRRKSSIDNEDVSQSVSDTIKRYLRMARKKSVHDDNANRFKRVNYDRNLRNIRAKGEINPPGMDEGFNKATQTLDAWPIISLDFIRGHENNGVLEEAHLEWQKSLDARIQQKQDYDNKLKLQQLQEQRNEAAASSVATKTSSSSSSAPTSPTNASHQGHGGSSMPTPSGILHSSTQFLANLWHGSGGAGGGPHSERSSTTSQDSGYRLPGSNTSSIMSLGTNASGQSYNSKGDTSAMQKSKSSSNVGQFVSKKIFKTRSKSQTRTSSPTKAEWTPQGNCTWTSDNGRQVKLTNSNLQNLTEIEVKILQRVAIEKINQLNIGVSVAVPSDTETAGKANKRRPLAKKKAMTTSFFDIGRKDDKGSNVSIFGNSLQECVANDIKRRTNLISTSDRGSRNSITSLFRGSSNNKVRSCESLPSSGTYNLPHSESKSADRMSSGNGNLVKNAAMLMSRSQTDVRRASQDFEDNSILSGASPPPSASMADREVDENGDQLDRQVPTFVQECIKHLEKYGLHSVGLFRVSTSKKRVRQMRESLDRSSSTFIDPETCPHDVATLLKEFLRDLPEPLLCRNLYKAFIKTQKIRNRRLQLEALSHLVQLLPTAHRDTLFVLLRFLAKVASYCDDITTTDNGSTKIVAGNKMDSNNLATVFAPNILRSSLTGEENNEQVAMGDVINVIRTMIDHYEELFRVQAELMDEIYANMIDTFPEQLNYLCERRNAAAAYEEHDSVSSNTPVHSPPPIAVMKSVGIGDASSPKQQNVYQFYNETPSDGRTHSESSYSSTTTGRVPPIPATTRRMYTRDDVMHGNAVSKGDPPEDGSKRRSSKSRQSETDSSPQQPPRSSLKFKAGKSTESSKESFSSPTTTTTLTTSLSKSTSTNKVEFHSMHNPQQQQQQQQQMQSAVPLTASTRRLSSPYVLDRTGIVTASLKIPVQMQQTQQTATSGGGGVTFDDDEVFYLGSGQFDLSNIPYIEDSTTFGNDPGNCIEGFPITGSLLFGAGGGVNADGRSSSIRGPSAGAGGAQIYQIPIAFESGDHIVSSAGESSPFLSPSLSKSSTATAARSKEKKTVQQTVQQDKPKTNSQDNIRQTIGQMEQKLPTSISNIGGAILRSKTADFERMASPATPAPTSSDRSRQHQTPGHSYDETNPSSASRGQQLYKRQALISSAKRK